MENIADFFPEGMFFTRDRHTLVDLGRSAQTFCNQDAQHNHNHRNQQEEFRHPFLAEFLIGGGIVGGVIGGLVIGKSLFILGTPEERLTDTDISRIIVGVAHEDLFIRVNGLAVFPPVLVCQRFYQHIAVFGSLEDRQALRTVAGIHHDEVITLIADGRNFSHVSESPKANSRLPS